MAYVPSGLRNLSNFSDHNELTGYFRGTQPLISSTGTSYGQGTPEAGAGPNEFQPTTSTGGSPTPGGPQPSSLYDPSQGNTASALLSPVQSGIKASTQELRSLGEQFGQQAGQLPTFQSVGGAQTLEGVLKGSGSLEPARQLLTTQYSGPSGLNPEAVADIRQTAQDFLTQSRALQTGGGVQNILKLGVPGLTGGEARFEAGTVFSDPGFRQKAQAAQGAAQGFLGSIGEAEQAAKAMGERQELAAKNIREASKGFIQGRRQDVLSDLEKEVARKAKEQSAVQSAYDNFMRTGDLGFLPPGIREQYAGTPVAELRGQAEQQWGDIFGQYPDLEKFPALQRRVSHRGHEKFTKPGQPFQGIPFQMDNLFSKVLYGGGRKQELEARQKALEAYFSPGTHHSIKRKEEPGEYAGVMPLYGYTPGEGGGFSADQMPDMPFERPDMRNYLGLDMGVMPGKQNLSTEKQRNVFNRASELLDSADRLEKAGEPFRAAQMMADMERFIEDENAALESTKEKQSAAAKEWHKTVKKIHKAYQKAKDASRWGDVLSIAGPALFAMGAPALIAGGTLMGGISGKQGGEKALEKLEKNVAALGA